MKNDKLKIETLFLISVWLIFNILFFSTSIASQAVIYSAFFTVLIFLTIAMLRDQEQYQQRKIEKEYEKFYDRSEIAEWEASHKSLDRFWVIIPDFLGDSDDFFNSMKKNLASGTKYTYFLFQEKDIISLMSLNERLKQALELEKKKMESDQIQFVYVRCDTPISLSLESYFFESRLFIAHPNKKHFREGFRLYSDSENETNVMGGFKITKDFGLKNIVNRYKVLMKYFKPRKIEEVNIDQNNNITNLDVLQKTMVRYG